MNRDEVLERLHFVRARFDQRVRAIPLERFDIAPPGRVHTPKEILSHVTAYEALIIDRLRAARLGETTAHLRDRVGWEEFNEQTWSEAAALSATETLAHADEVFRELIHEIMLLSDIELVEKTGITEHIDPSWLQGRALWEVIGIDGFEHYPMHFEAFEEAAAAARA